MTRRLERDSPLTRMATLQNEMLDEQRKPNLPGFWVCIGDFDAYGSSANDPACTSTSSPPYQDGTTYAGPPYDYPAFRHGLDGALEWKGHVDVSGASSPAVLCTLPGEWRPDFDVSWPTDVWDGAAFVIGRVGIDASTGDVTLVWPAS